MDDDEESESGSSSELELVAGANHSHVGHISLWNVLDPYMRTTRNAVNWFTYGLPPPANGSAGMNAPASCAPPDYSCWARWRSVLRTNWASAKRDCSAHKLVARNGTKGMSDARLLGVWGQRPLRA